MKSCRHDHWKSTAIEAKSSGRLETTRYLPEAFTAGIVLWNYTGVIAIPTKHSLRPVGSNSGKRGTNDRPCPACRQAPANKPSAEVDRGGGVDWR